MPVKLEKARFVIDGMALSTSRKYPSNATMINICCSAIKAASMDGVNQEDYYTVLRRKSGTYAATTDLFVGMSYKGGLYVEKAIVFPEFGLLFSGLSDASPVLTRHSHKTGATEEQYPCKDRKGYLMTEIGLLSTLSAICCMFELDERGLALEERFTVEE